MPAAWNGSLAMVPRCVAGVDIVNAVEYQVGNLRFRGGCSVKASTQTGDSDVLLAMSFEELRVCHRSLGLTLVPTLKVLAGVETDI